MGEAILVLFGVIIIWAIFKVKPTPRRKKIPISVQAEIDQTPEWWDNEFRRLQGLPPKGYEASTSWAREVESRIKSVTYGDTTFRAPPHFVDFKPPSLAELRKPGFAQGGTCHPGGSTSI